MPSPSTLKLLVVVMTSCLFSLARAACDPPVWINEFHYDNGGVDEGEFIEIAGPAGTDVSGYQIVLYNGNDGQVYGTRTVPQETVLADVSDGYGFYVETYPANGIQNGAPDGLALVDSAGDVLQFLSYEGTFSANDGPASGNLSLDVGVQEFGSETIGLSLQLKGTGSCYANFTWTAPSTQSPGSENAGQTFGDGGGTSGPTTVPTSVPTLSCHLIENLQETTPFNDRVRICGAVVTRLVSNGYYIQQGTSSSNGFSTGIFVYTSSVPTAVSVGDKVDVIGNFGAFSGLNQITSAFAVVIDSGVDLPGAVSITLPIEENGNLFAFQCMIVSLKAVPESGIYVSEYFQLARFGEFLVCSAPTSEGRLFQYTQFNAPDATGFVEYQNFVRRSCILIDDGNSAQNPDPILLGGVLPFSTDLPLRGGAEITKAEGVLSFAFDSFRIVPLTAQDLLIKDRFAGRKNLVLEELGRHKVRVVAINVLNYFTSLNQGSTPYRGANNEEEFLRQSQKLLTGLCEMDADVYALIEIENTISNAAVYDLVRRLNEQCNGDGTRHLHTTKALKKGERKGDDSGRLYTAVSIEEKILKTGTDAIKVELVYDSNILDLLGSAVLDDATLENVGGKHILDATENNVIFGCNPCLDGSSRSGLSRAPLAGTFQVKKGRIITMVANHFKSKGASGVSSSSPNSDKNDGAGNWNLLRTQTAEAVLFWLESNPTRVETDNILIVGDLNSYAKEDPVKVLNNAGYVSVKDLDSNPPPYSYVFSGQWGTLDYIFMSTALADNLVKSQTWFVNADEVPALDYNTDFNRPDIFDGSTPWRHSDHDPIIATFSLDKEHKASNRLF